MTTTLPAATRVVPLPVRVDATNGQFAVYVGDRKVASAWGPAADDPDAWFLWNGRTDPYRVSGGRDGAQALIEGIRDERRRREGSLWHPAHGQPDDSDYVAKAPPGAVCVLSGCNVGGETYVATATYQRDGQTTRHYVCMNCAQYFEHDEDED